MLVTRLTRYICCFLFFGIVFFSVFAESAHLNQNDLQYTTYIEADPKDLYGPMNIMIRLLCGALPFATLWILIGQKGLHDDQVWSVLESSSARVESEVYKYRCAIGAYKALHARDMIATAAALQASGGSVVAVPTSKNVLADEVQLVREGLAAISDMGFIARCSGVGAPSHLFRNGEQRPPSQFLAEESDDGFSRMTSSKYVDLRLLPSIQTFEARLFYLQIGKTIADAVGGIAIATAAILGLLKILFLTSAGTIVTSFMWTPVVAIFTCLVEATVRFENLDARIRATNDALSSLRSVEMWWTAQNAIKQGLLENKALLVSSTEDALISYTAALTSTAGSRKRAFERKIK